MSQVEESNSAITKKHSENSQEIETFKKRMLDWSNPVEFVNNMYGSHPENEGTEYFKRVFS